MRTSARPAAMGSVDVIEELGAVPSANGSVGRGSFVMVRGWILNGARRPVESLELRIGTDRAQAMIGLARPDVIAQFSDASATGGFVGVVALTQPEGAYTVALDAMVGGEVETLDSGKVVNVVSAREPLEGLRARDAGWDSSIDGIFNGDAPVSRDAHGVFVLNWGAPASIRMWAIDTLNGRVPRRVHARLGGVYVPVIDGYLRPDAANINTAPGAARCGFSIPVSAPLTGIVTVEIFAQSFDGSFAHIGDVRFRRDESLSTDALPESSDLEGYLDELSVDGGPCAPGEPVTVSAGTLVDVRGWAIDRNGPCLCSEFVLHGAGDGEGNRWARAQRHDLVEANDNPSLLDSGFTASFQTSDLPLGSHQVQLRALSARRDAYANIGAPFDLIVSA